MLKLSDLNENKSKPNEEEEEKIRSLGGRFIKGKQKIKIGNEEKKIEIRFKVEEDDSKDFWENVSANFTDDGRKATV